MNMVWFVIGCWVGGMAGFLAAALIQAAHKEPDAVIYLSKEAPTR